MSSDWHTNDVPAFSTSQPELLDAYTTNVSWCFGIANVADAYRPVHVNPTTLAPAGSGCDRPHASASRLAVHASGPSPAVVVVSRGDAVADVADGADGEPTSVVVGLDATSGPIGVVLDGIDEPCGDVVGAPGAVVVAASGPALVVAPSPLPLVVPLADVVGATRADGWSRHVDSSRPARASVPTTAATAPCRGIAPPRPRRG
jgi:hypothetical protein